MKKLLFPLFLLLFAVAVQAQIQDPVKFKSELKTLAADEAEVVFTAAIDKGWHVYSTDLGDGGPISATFNVEKISGAEVAGKLKPVGKEISTFDKLFEMKVRYFENTAQFVQKLKLTGGAYQLEGYLEYGACNDENCLPPTQVPFQFSGKAEGAAKEAAAATVETKVEEQPAKQEAATDMVSVAVVGGADGPTAIFTTIKLAPHLLGPIAIAAYSYMALVPVIIPLVVKLFCTKKELSINMKEQEKKYPSKTEIKNLRVLKIIFPIVVTTIVALFVPSAVPLIGMLMFGNLVKEIGSNTFRLFDAASNSIMNAATIFLGLSVGATMTAEAFLNWTTIGIVIGGFLAFALSITGGIFFVKLVNLFSKKKINPLIGATGLSAVPMASRVANEIALKYDPKNHVLQYCMASNISGVIGSAVAAGVLISFLA